MTNVAKSLASGAPRLGFVGPHLGRHPGWVTTQSEIVSDLFSRDGFPVRRASSVRPAIPRAVDTLGRLVAWRAAGLVPRSGGVDVVIVSVFSGPALRLAEATARTAAALGLPQIHWLHGGGLDAKAGAEPERLRRLFGRAAAVVAPSAWLARSAERLGIEGRVIPNVLELADLDHRPRAVPTERPPRILWMRAFHELYEPLLAVDALARLHRDGVPARLTLAGQDKGLEAACRDRVQALDLAEFVEFPGFLDAAAKRRAFATHDVFWNTNRVDNAPVSVLEALASGLPVVATAVGGVPDLLEHGRCGLLVPAGDDDALAAAVGSLRDAPEATAERVAAGRARAEASAWPAVRAQWLDLVAAIRGSGTTPPGHE